MDENSSEPVNKLALKQLNFLLEKIEQEKKFLQFSREHATTTSNDVCTWYLQAKSLEIKDLREEINKFDITEEHFLKRYKVLEGQCSKIQTDLDKIDVFGREDLRALRKAALTDIEDLLQRLAAKTHKDGMLYEKHDKNN